MYADKYGLGVFNIRIGNLWEEPVDRRRLSIWISPRDLVQLMRIGLEHPEIHFEVVYGVSDNARAWYDNANAHRLGYRPEDQAEDYAASATEADLSCRPTRSASSSRAAASAPWNSLATSKRFSNCT